MKRFFIIIFLIYPFLQLNATSYAQPEKKKVFSENKKFFIMINPESNIHYIYNSHNTKKSLWNFKKEAWHSTWLITNNGKKVIWISWKFVKTSELNEPCIIVFNKKGNTKAYSFKQIAKPRKYKKREIGPIGKFWRVWYESILEKKDKLIINISGDKKIIVSRIDGSIEL